MLEPRKFYRVENMVRAQTSRVQRQASATRHRAALWVLGRRVLPRQPLLLTPAEYEQHKTVLLAKVRLGEISIVRPDQVRIDSKSDGTLIYYPLNKPATLVEPPMGTPVVAEPDAVIIENLEPIADTTDEVVVESEFLPLPDDAPTPVPDMVSGAVQEPHPDDVITSKLPVPEQDVPRMCAICREQPALDGMSTCTTCTPPPIEHKPIEIDTMPQEETPPELAEEPVVVTPLEAPAVPSRKSKKKGKKS
jgi:hypothetical protein